MNKLDMYLDLVNEVKKEKGLDTYIPLYPMLRTEGNKLFVVVLLVKDTDNIWNREEAIKASYWALIDIENNQVIEFNKTEDKDYENGKFIHKEVGSNNKEMSMYFVDKTLKYKEYLMNDIKNDHLPLQNKIIEVLNNEIEIDDEKVNLKEYLFANLESEVSQKINELVEFIMKEKYHSMIVLYETLVKNIVTDYKSKKTIDEEKMNLCMEMMNNYYEGIIGIESLFHGSNK